MSRGYAAIGLFNPKTEPNIGGVLRAASCYSAKMVAIQGARYHKQSTDTCQTWRHVPLLHVEDLITTNPFQSQIVAVELCDDAEPLQGFKHPERAFYLFGPEDGSIKNEIIERSHHKVFVPTKHCMNLAATVNVVLYDRLAKQMEAPNA